MLNSSLDFRAISGSGWHTNNERVQVALKHKIEYSVDAQLEEFSNTLVKDKQQTRNDILYSNGWRVQKGLEGLLNNYVSTILNVSV
jgi:hypothetical protein